MGEYSGESCRLRALTTEAGMEMPVHGKPGKTMKLFFPPFPQTLEIDNADFHIPTPRLRPGEISPQTRRANRYAF
jgi:hypothetical protein